MKLKSRGQLQKDKKKQPSHTHSRFLFLSSSLFSHFTCSFHLESIVSKAHSPGAAPVLRRCQRGKVIKDNVTHDARIWKKLGHMECGGGCTVVEIIITNCVTKQTTVTAFHVHIHSFSSTWCAAVAEEETTNNRAFGSLWRVM